MKRTSYELRAARKKVGLTIAKAAALAMIPVSTWERWELSPDVKSAGRTPNYPFQFLRCYKILKEHDLLEELLKSEE
jgi:hypothetical protein